MRGKEASVTYAIAHYMTGYGWLAKFVTGCHPCRIFFRDTCDAAWAVARVLFDEQGLRTL